MTNTLLTKGQKDYQRVKNDPIKRQLAYNRMRLYHKNNSEKIKIRKRELRNNRKKECFYYYSNGTMSCLCCGENTFDFLSLDHIDNNGTNHRKQLKFHGGDDLYLWIISHDFPEIFQVSCMNCNWGRGKKSNINHICPHNLHKPTLEIYKSWQY